MQAIAEKQCIYAEKRAGGTLAERKTAKGFFAPPYRFWERGLNENTNGLIGKYIPKGKEIGLMNNGEVQSIMDKLNSRPRNAGCCTGELNLRTIISLRPTKKNCTKQNQPD